MATQARASPNELQSHWVAASNFSCNPCHCSAALQRNADALAMGIRAICYELTAPKDEIVDLILKNQSVLHGREMHLSVADIAHLAMLREPKGRIAE